MATSPVVAFPASRALAGQVAAERLWERPEEEEEALTKPRSRALFVNLPVFLNSGCGEIHAASGVLQSSTGNQDLCPVLVFLILRLPGSNHSSLLRVH